MEILRKEKYFEYMGAVDSNVLSTHEVKQENIDKAKEDLVNGNLKLVLSISINI